MRIFSPTFWLINTTIYIILVATNKLPAVAETLSISQQIEEIVAHLVGAMDTSQQAKENPNSPNVRITTCEVKLLAPASKVETKNLLGNLLESSAIFLYQEQAMSNNLTKPYRQRFLKIAPSPITQTVVSVAYKPSQGESWIGFCDRPLAQRVVPAAELGQPRCSVFLKKAGETYIGETPEGGCPSDFRGAFRVTNRIILHRQGMDTSDRAYDALGNQVWGANQSTYQFRWLPGYPSGKIKL